MHLELEKYKCSFTNFSYCLPLVCDAFLTKFDPARRRAKAVLREFSVDIWIVLQSCECLTLPQVENSF